MWKLISFSILLILSGCATRGQESLFERNPTLDTAIKSETAEKSLATVYLIRPGLFLQAFMQATVPPVHFAVNDQILSAAPLKTYIRLHLAPGRHKISTLVVVKDMLVPPQILGAELQIEVQAEKKYYVEYDGGVRSPTLRLLADSEGQKSIKDVELARLLYAPLTTEEFRRRVGAQYAGSSAPSQRSSAVQIAESALPSNATIANFFEGFATIALVALTLAGTVALAAAQSPQVPDKPSAPFVYPAYIQRIPNPAPNSRPITGVVPGLLNDASEYRLRNASTGITYRVTEDRIIGSDGSRYRVIGSNIYGDNGISYQKVGSAIYGSDGRSCDIIMSTIHCKR